MSGALTCTDGITDEEPCLWCGEPRSVALFEMWDHGHAFMLDTCCEGALAEISEGIADDPAWGRALLQRLGAEAYAGHRLRRVADDGAGTLLLDYRLQIRPVPIPLARTFVARHHAHCGPPTVTRYAFGAYNAGLLLGVAMVGNPVAPALNDRGILEVNRLCIRRDVARVLAWNACSALYARCAQETERRGFGHIITYTRQDEHGTRLVAAGWTREAVVRGRGWHSARRPRGNGNAFVDKTRWGRALRPKPAQQPTRNYAHPAPVPNWLRAGELDLCYADANGFLDGQNCP